MKEKDYILKIVTTQYTEGETEQIFMDTLAVVTGNKDSYYITYRDNDGDLAGCETRLHISGGSKVSINRRGIHNSHIIIEKSIRHLSHHITPQMSFTMGVSCVEMESDFDKGKLHFRYATDIEMVPVGEIEFDFEFRKAERE